MASPVSNSSFVDRSKFKSDCFADLNVTLKSLFASDPQAHVNTSLNMSCKEAISNLERLKRDSEFGETVSIKGTIQARNKQDGMHEVKFIESPFIGDVEVEYDLAIRSIKIFQKHQH